jgi:hypothetical protein
MRCCGWAGLLPCLRKVGQLLGSELRLKLILMAQGWTLLASVSRRTWGWATDVVGRAGFEPATFRV